MEGWTFAKIYRCFENHNDQHFCSYSDQSTNSLSTYRFRFVHKKTQINWHC